MSVRIYRCNRCAKEIIVNDTEDDLKPKRCEEYFCGGVLHHTYTVPTFIR